MNITQERLKDILHYDPDTGVFVWKVATGRRIKIGYVAGSPNDKGYLRIQINKARTYSHRLAVLYMDGYFPEEVDHINGVKDDNRWCNLRPCNRLLNAKNSRMLITNTSGVKGVFMIKSTGKYRASIMVSGKMMNLGNYNTMQEAEIIVRQAREKHHGEYANHG